MDHLSDRPPEGTILKFRPELEIGPSLYVEKLIDIMLHPELIGIQVVESPVTNHIRDRFDWLDVLQKIGEIRDFPPDVDLDFHLMDFESTMKPDVSSVIMRQLEIADRNTLREALYTAPSGLIFYHPAPGGSFCLWSDSLTAYEATQGPEHQIAKDLAPKAYDSAVIHTYSLTRRENGTKVKLTDGHTFYPLEHTA